LLSGVTHFLCVLDRSDLDCSWLAFIVGFARGKSVHLALKKPDTKWKPKPWINDLLVFDDGPELLRYYRSESVEWKIREGRQSAKATLLELGISWHGESLCHCVKEGNTKAVELFLLSGFPPDTRDKFGVPILCLAARSKHRNIVELLLDQGAFVDSQGDDRGYSSLLDAAQQGDKGIVEMLLERGANPDIQSKDGQTALILAVGRNDGPMVSTLLACGANSEITDKLGLSARKYAKLFNHPAVFALFGPES
jgi:ankyrin repeat protein